MPSCKQIKTKKFQCEKELKLEQSRSVDFSLVELTEFGSLLGKIKISQVIMVFQKTEEKKEI